LWITLIHLAANKVPCVLDWVHIKGHGRPMKYIIRLLLPEFSYNASSKRFGVIVHKDHPVIQWIIIKMGYNVYSKHMIVVCSAIEVTLSDM
jgi:hypothetical protein